MHVTLKDIRKYFGPIRANDGISLSLEGGRIYGLLGENGAGKSTLMKILSGFHRPDSGHIELNGEHVGFDSPADALARGVGMIYQDPLDVPAMRVIENFLLGRDSKMVLDYASGTQALLEHASRMGFHLDPLSYIETLSLGERQQLELLRLLSLGAEVLILDEPTTGISAEQKECLFASLRKLAGEGKTIILVSHKLSDVQELCHHVMVLRRGRPVGQADIPCPTEQLVRMMFVEVPPRTKRASFVREEMELEVQQLSIATERLMIENIGLSIRAGEVFGLAGLEGSGQRLLIQACAGLVRPLHGRVVLAGEDMTRWSYHRRRNAGVAYVPSGRLEEGLVAGLSLMEHVALSSPQRGFVVDRRVFSQEAQARIEHYQIVGRPETNVEALSGGNQQRTLFALIREDVKLLLLEHPTRGLDVRSAEWIWELLFRRVELGMAVLFISVDLDELIERSDRIAAFSGGVMSRAVAAAETTAGELGRLIGGEQ
jgi:simple sugar transport system ATP-binding protein